MKLLLKSTLLIMLTHTAYGQITDSCDTCPFPSRDVTNLGIDMWRAMYQELGRLGEINNSYTPDTVSFSRKFLDSLYYNNTPGTINSSTKGTVMFRYYMVEDNDNGNGKPKLNIAIGSCADTSRYLIKIDGREEIVKLNEYQPLMDGFNLWEAILTVEGTPLIYVTSYNYCWSNIGIGFSRPHSDHRLYIENVAHTVSPLDTNYQLPEHSSYEGYVAFDIALAFKRSVITNPTGEVGSTSQFVDFAAPCPKACYQNR
jgi:hypothetical protein